MLLRKVKHSFLKNLEFSRLSSHLPNRGSQTFNTQNLLSCKSEEDHAHLTHLSTFNASDPRVVDCEDKDFKMFTSRGLFAEIICPYEEKCLLPGCVFSHSKPAEPAPAPTSISTEPQKQKAKLEDPGQDPKTVKRRLEPEMVTPPRGTNDRQKTAVVPKERVFVGEPVSPPPLRRKALDGNAILVTKQAPKSQDSPLIPKAKQPLKKEGLNPRALKTKG